MRRKLTKGTMTALRQAAQHSEERKFPGYDIAVAVRTTTNDLGQPIVMISRSKKSRGYEKESESIWYGLWVEEQEAIS